MIPRIALENNPTARKAYLKIRELFHSFALNRNIALVDQHIEHVCGKETLSRTSDDCIVVTVVRNGEFYIQEFIEHYLSLGFKHIFFIDNGSTDSTVSIAAQYDHVSVYRCPLPFKHYKDAMRSYLLNRFSYGRWCLLADIDEFFDYPYRESIDLAQLINYFNQRQDSAVLLQMLDMYPDCNIQDLGNRPHQSVRDAHQFFEVATITKQAFPSRFDYKITNPNIKLHYGGVRKRLFGADPLLSKLALVKPSWPSYQVNPHWRSSAKVSDISCVLFHYKYTDSFPDLVETAISEKQYYRDSHEYMDYHEAMKQADRVSFCGHDSVKIKDLSQLLSLGLIQVSAAYEEYCNLPK